MKPLLVYILGFTIIGIAFGTRTIEECIEPFQDEQILIKSLDDPTVDELQVVCPLILHYISCIEDVAGFALDDFLEIAPEGEIKRAVTTLYNIKSTFTELCTEGTQLNLAYQEHAECYETALPDNGVECVEQAEKVFDTYKEFEDKVQEEAGESISIDKRECYVAAYMIACAGAEIHEKCGSAAFETMMEIMRRTTVFRNALCSAEDLSHLKTSFLTSLDLEESQRDIFEKAFELKRRRRK